MRGAVTDEMETEEAEKLEALLGIKRVNRSEGVAAAEDNTLEQQESY